MTNRDLEIMRLHDVAKRWRDQAASLSEMPDVADVYRGMASEIEDKAALLKARERV